MESFSGDGISGGTFISYPLGGQTINAINVVLTHNDITGSVSDAGIAGNNWIGLQVLENVLHWPNPGTIAHALYIGSNTAASSGVIVQRNVMYDVFSGVPNAQFNGRCTGCDFSQNLIYNGNSQGFAFLQGVSSSRITSNVIFNIGTFNNPPVGIRFATYSSGDCTTLERLLERLPSVRGPRLVTSSRTTHYTATPYPRMEVGQLLAKFLALLITRQLAQTAIPRIPPGHRAAP